VIETALAVVSVAGAAVVAVLFVTGLLSLPKHPSERERWRDRLATIPIGLPDAQSGAACCLEGTVEGRPTLTSPVHGVRCFAYVVFVDEMHLDRKRTPTWMGIRRNSDASTFFLAGSFGRARVDADRTTDLVGQTMRAAVRSSFFVRNDEAETRFLESIGLATSSIVKAVQVREWTLTLGANCTVVGVVGSETDPQSETGGYRAPPETLVVRSSQHTPLAILEGSRAQILAG